MSLNKELEQLEQERIESLKELTVPGEKKILTPLNIGYELSEINKQLNSIADLNEKVATAKKLVSSLNAKTPDWVWMLPKIQRDSTGVVKKVEVKDGYDHTKMGDELISNYHLIRFPKLSEGAVYDNKLGYWRYFGKNEMKSFVESEVLKLLQKWGYYDNRHIIPTRIYVLQKTYDKSFPNATPFEESKPELAVFKNGTYDILNDIMRPNDPKDYILNAHNYNLDMSGNETPHTDALFEGMLGENAIFLKQFIGYMFYRSHAPAQEMVFFKGTGGEGKSTLLNFISEHIIGLDNRSTMTPHELSQDKFASADLLGKSVNISADIKDDYIEDSSMLKRLTGGDGIRAQYKGIQGFNMVNHAKFVFSANKLPRFRDDTEGYFDRLVVLKFINGNQRISGATFWKQHDMEKVKKEAHAFTHSCMRAFKSIFDGSKAEFTKPEGLVNETKKWFYDNDHIGEFLFDAATLHTGEDRGEIAAVVHREYQAFCKENGYQPKSSQSVRDYLEKKDIPKRRGRKGFKDGSSNQWRYIGLELVLSYILLDDFNK